MGEFIFMTLVGVAGLVAVIAGVLATRATAGARAGFIGGGVCAMVLSLFVIVFTQMMQTVGAQDIGIVLNGGRPVGHIGPGRSFISPWEDVTTMDNAVQPVDYGVADPASGRCEILIRIANQQTACARVKLRVQPNPAAVDQLYRQYRSTQGVIAGLVTPWVQNYANVEFQNFDPIADVNSTEPIGSPSRPTASQIAVRIENDLQGKLGSEVKIDGLLISTIDYDSAVQAQLNAAFAQKAKTVIAAQAVQTAQQQALANKQLATAGSSSPLALVQQCMTYLGVLADKGLTPPAGFSCWPGQGSGIVIPAGK